MLSEKLDPTQLDWQQFWVIEREGYFVACGQLRNFPEAQELGTVVVVPAWRGRGLGSFLVKYLIQEATQPLYLECVGERRALFYARFGFVQILWQDLPPLLKLKFGFAQLFRTLFGISGVIMHYRGLPSEINTLGQPNQSVRKFH